ncbi:polynucleotide adenylyltransferase PcnB [Pontiella agarivorans]|uniref:Poly(A) polymerase I n=1 Tax=Pontiella agarivorans TaxID=3038953 RepID=A0ABU5N0B5_9BACT|nr:polynucleotide adenylyltransferase PcnB [Pontiella agarivorans]MDZ8119666.1 polynucleotide adenylyltransferase PcnB [Pontiella agarivorans]
MEPIILKRADHKVSRKNISSAAIKVLYHLKDEGYTAYLAGGGVRDLLLDRNPKDFDVATDATPEQIRKMFRNCRLVGRRFRLAHILFRGEIIETSTFRAPVPEDPNETLHGENTLRIEESGMVLRDNIWGTPEEDAMRRDFTINALFYNIADFSVIDYAGGLKDLENRIIRVIGEPDKRFAEDPVRMIRAARFAGSLGFDIEEEALKSICRNNDLLKHAAPSRMYEEVQKLFFCSHAKAVFQWLEKTNLLHPMFHDFSHWLDEDKVRHDWVYQTLEQMDRWRRAGLRVHPALLFALIFGEYHEFLIDQLVERGMSSHEAARNAVQSHLKDMCTNVRVPKTAIYQICDIMSNQARFHRTKGRKPQRFIQSKGFLDAFLYFKFSSKAHGRDEELLEYWTELRKSTPQISPARKGKGSRKPQTKSEIPIE